MAYFIKDNCIGCTICAQKCPVPSCITGETKKLHVINPVTCIDCGVCGSYCPVDDCIYDQYGKPTSKIKPQARPVAIVDESKCTGCEMCIDVCPFDCIELLTDERHETLFKVAKVTHPRDCVACSLCTLVCSDKEAIPVRWPDGPLFNSFQDIPEGAIAARKKEAA